MSACIEQAIDRGTPTLWNKETLTLGQWGSVFRLPRVLGAQARCTSSHRMSHGMTTLLVDALYSIVLFYIFQFNLLHFTALLTCLT